jgi:hypothetical protein
LVHSGSSRFASALRGSSVASVSGFIQRQEGRGAGDGVRLHGRSKALKGKTP